MPNDDSGQSRRALLAEALLFLGMLVSVGGSLTVIVRGYREPFFFGLIIIGFIMWGAGFALKSRDRKRG